MSAAFRHASAEDTGWRPADVSSAAPAARALEFHTSGRDLVVELRRWHAGETRAIVDPGELDEELGAVLEGRYELVCGDERYELEPGSGILVPPGEPRTWRVLSDEGVLYRVICPEKPS